MRPHMRVFYHGKNMVLVLHKLSAPIMGLSNSPEHQPQHDIYQGLLCALQIQLHRL